MGMDIMTYMKEGIGRHADSLGNREEFASPGFQWISVGSGIEHAEGGGTPIGQRKHGFQVWVNVPAARKQDDPKYGTVHPSAIPRIERTGLVGLVIAGSVPDSGIKGPFETQQPVQIIDFELEAYVDLAHSVDAELNCCLVYCYRGSGVVSGSEPIAAQQVARLDASSDEARTVTIQAGPQGLGFMLFAGKRIGETITWHGPPWPTRSKRRGDSA